MTKCFICYDSILHGVMFSCKHEICIHCFMKLDKNLCPYCRTPIHETHITHYSQHIPPFLRIICKNQDIFSYVLLQIYHTNIYLFTPNNLIKEINSWCMDINITNLYIHEIKVLFKLMHPEKYQLLILLSNLLFLSFLFKDNVIIIHEYPYEKIIVFYPIFLLLLIFTSLCGLHITYEYIKLQKFNFQKRNEIKIENIME
jgi:hypothetical protein